MRASAWVQADWIHSEDLDRFSQIYYSFKKKMTGSASLALEWQRHYGDAP